MVVVEEPPRLADDEKNIEPKIQSSENVDKALTDEKEEELQHGAKAAEAMVQVWTTRDLVLAYILYVFEHLTTYNFNNQLCSPSVLVCGLSCSYNLLFQESLGP